MALDQRLLAILACPQDKGPLHYLGDGADGGLYNPRLHLRYPVRDGIPVMLSSEAEHLDDGAHATVVARIESEGIPATFDASAAPLA